MPRRLVASIRAGLRRFRFRLADFLVRMWLLLALNRRTFPLPVSLKRLAAPLFVLIFGIPPPASRKFIKNNLIKYPFAQYLSRFFQIEMRFPGSPLPERFIDGGRSQLQRSGTSALWSRSQDHGHVPALELGCLLYNAHLFYIRNNSLENPQPQIRVSDFSPAEHDGHFCFIFLG